MKIRYYKNINGWRWLGFFIAMASVSILSSANISTVNAVATANIEKIIST